MGLAIFTWTVDDPETLRELARAAVDGVYTTRPDIARRVFDELPQRSKAA
jgi:glycerophosphoryl diester phosphodiesterase